MHVSYNKSYDKVGVVTFRMFVADRQFGTHLMLFFGVKLPLNS